MLITTNASSLAPALPAYMHGSMPHVHQTAICPSMQTEPTECNASRAHRVHGISSDGSVKVLGHTCSCGPTDGMGHPTHEGEKIMPFIHWSQMLRAAAQQHINRSGYPPAHPSVDAPASLVWLTDPAYLTPTTRGMMHAFNVPREMHLPVATAGEGVCPQLAPGTVYFPASQAATHGNSSSKDGGNSSRQWCFSSAVFMLANMASAGLLPGAGIARPFRNTIISMCQAEGGERVRARLARWRTPATWPPRLAVLLERNGSRPLLNAAELLQTLHTRYKGLVVERVGVNGRSTLCEQVRPCCLFAARPGPATLSYDRLHVKLTL